MANKLTLDCKFAKWYVWVYLPVLSMLRWLFPAAEFNESRVKYWTQKALTVRVVSVD